MKKIFSGLTLCAVVGFAAPANAETLYLKCNQTEGSYYRERTGEWRYESNPNDILYVVYSNRGEIRIAFSSNDSIIANDPDYCGSGWSCASSNNGFSLEKVGDGEQYEGLEVNRVTGTAYYQKSRETYWDKKRFRCRPIETAF